MRSSPFAGLVSMALGCAQLAAPFVFTHAAHAFRRDVQFFALIDADLFRAVVRACRHQDLVANAITVFLDFSARSAKLGPMPNCDFYACGGDAVEVVRFVLSQPGWSLWELASRPDCELRQFSTEAELLQVYDVSSESALFNLHAPEMGGSVIPQRITFNPGAVPDATFRVDSGGWGLIQLYLEAPRDGKLRASHTNHNSQKRALKWEPTYLDRLGPVDAWDWKAVSRVSSRLNRFIRSRATSKSGTRFVLPCAQDASSQGKLQLL